MFKKKDVVYYTKIIPSCGIYDVYELRIRTVEDDWFVGIEKRDEHAHLFNNSDIEKTIFTDRNEAVEGDSSLTVYSIYSYVRKHFPDYETQIQTPRVSNGGLDLALR